MGYEFLLWEVPSWEFEIPPPLSRFTVPYFLKYHSIRKRRPLWHQNDNLDCDDLTMVIDDNYEFNFEGKSYRSCTDMFKPNEVGPPVSSPIPACLLPG